MTEGIVTNRQAVSQQVFRQYSLRDLSLPELPPVEAPPIVIPPIIPQLPGVGEQAWGEAGRYAYPTVALAMASRHANRRMEAIGRFDRAVLKARFGDLVDRVDLFYGADPIDEYSVGPYKIKLDDVEAQTFGYRIYIRYAKEDLSDFARLELLAHELVHVQQYERFGQSLSNFGYHYFVEEVRANFSNSRNKLEREAYDFAAANSKQLLKDYLNEVNPPILCLVGKCAAFKVENVTSGTLNYSIRWSDSGDWKSYSLSPGKATIHYIDAGCGEISWNPRIKFDFDFSSGYQERSYRMAYDVVTKGPNGAASGGVRYFFKNKGSGVDLFRNNLDPASLISFTKLPGSASDISVGANGTAWAIGTDKQAFGYGVYKFVNGQWSPVNASGLRIAVDTRGAPWVINNKNEIWRLNTASGAWVKLPGSAKDIGIGTNGAVWVIGTDSQADGNGNGIYRWTGSNWSKIAGSGVRIAVDSTGRPWVVNNKDQIWYRNSENRWIQTSGSAKDIGAGGNGSVWVVGTDSITGGYGIYRWNGTAWTAANGGATGVAVGPDGKPWVVNSVNDIYRGS